VVASSKTYAPSATSPPEKNAGWPAQEHPMLDVLMLALAFGFFAAAIGYTYACERL